MEDVRRFERKLTAIFIGIMALVAMNGIGLLLLEGLRCGALK